MINKLPFLHVQVLEFLYKKIDNNTNVININELENETGYPSYSKILTNAINSLCQKNLIKVDFIKKDKDIFLKLRVPKEQRNFLKETISKNENQFLFEPTINLKSYFNEFKLGYNKISDSNKSKIELLNNSGIVHKWYDYLEDFPFEFTWNKIKNHCTKKNDIVLDPFMGSGTTLVTSKLMGHKSIGLDANPLMCFISKVKTNWNIDLDLLKKNMFSTQKELLTGFNNIKSVSINNDFIKNMPKKELNQWLSPSLQLQVSYTKDVINKIDNEEIKNLFLFNMAKSAFDASYVSLCPGTTFYPYREKSSFYELFFKRLVKIYYELKTLSDMNHYGSVSIYNEDSRKLSSVVKQKIKLSLTSPPYPNDLEYTRQTRLELYLLDFVKNMNDVRLLKERMIKGSTKLIFKDSDSSKYVKNNNTINEVADKISEALKEKDWGFDYPRMIREYFGDMFLNLRSVLDVLDDNGVYILVVGDQTYKEIVIPVGKILSNMAKEIGYSRTEIELHRMRRSTTHNIPLPEENVILYK